MITRIIVGKIIRWHSLAFVLITKWLTVERKTKALVRKEMAKLDRKTNDFQTRLPWNLLRGNRRVPLMGGPKE